MKCCSIKSSDLNRKVQLNKLVMVSTSTGGFSENWVKVADVWARIKNSTGSELMHADQLGSVAFSDFTIRYRANIDETMQLVYRATEFQIRHINNIEEQDLYMTVKAERGVSQ